MIRCQIEEVITRETTNRQTKTQTDYGFTD